MMRRSPVLVGYAASPLMRAQAPFRGSGTLTREALSVRLGAVNAPRPTDQRLGYRITMVLDFKSGTDRAHADLLDLLECLTRIDARYLRDHPETPPLYQSGVRYEEEPLGEEDWNDIPTMLKKRRYLDCLPLSTLVLRDDYTFAAMGDLVPGDRIMGDGRFTTVVESVPTGEKPILAFDLNNGCVLRSSPDHRFFREDGNEVRAEDVKVGDRLKSPSTPFPVGEAFRPDTRLTDEELAWLVGVYVADGWYQKKTFSISGFDDNPKRGKIEQKKRVKSICEGAGISASWYKKSVCVFDGPLSLLMASCGGNAPVKRLPTMRWSRDQIVQVLQGLETDASVANSGTVTHGTTSPILALQLRVLYRMLDQSVHIRRWDEHGGLGKSPIYRVGVRRHSDEGSVQTWKTRAEQYRTSVRVQAIREEESELCGDIETDTGRFYLPESDTIVHNCEDIACWRTAELRVREGIQAETTFTHQVKPDGGYLYHILVQYPDGRVEDPSRVLGMR